MLDNSNGFTRPGVERINDSIRTYCWAILGSQSQIKSDILGIGSAFDAQKQFLANVENGIQRSIDLPSQITRYQNTLKYARSKVDYVFGLGLYMAPSNMELRIGTIEGYNNKIILSTHDQKLWWNATVYPPASATSYSNDVSGTKPRKSTPANHTTPHTTPHTAPTDPQKPLKLDISPAAQGKRMKPSLSETAKVPVIETPKTASAVSTAAASAVVETHENNKTALIVGSIVIGSVALLI